ncbi:MAG: glycoside hydrolase family 3 N-terminal domain-containing protein, partial [Solirubrobacterales bacterium]
AIVGADGDGEDGSPPTADSTPTCPAQIAAHPRRLAGQMLIVRMEATATDGLRRLVRRGAIGGVILFPPAGTRASELRREIASLREAAGPPGVPEPLVMIDQEGGEVKRLPTLPPDRSPARIGAGGEAAAFEQGRATGAALAAVGVDVDLAPVLDVPMSTEAFIASRAFGSDSAEVARTGVAFGEGLEAGRVAATAKHFPGLGAATVNTDLAPSTIEATRAKLRSGLEPFRAAIAGGFDLVMVANATYPAYDPERIASQSPRVIDGLLRRRLGFEGLVVTDDLGAQALLGAGIGEAEAAVGAAGAGADLLLFAQSAGGVARDALVRALRRDELERETLISSCARSSALRERP